MFTIKELEKGSSAASSLVTSKSGFESDQDFVSSSSSDDWRRKKLVKK